MARKLSPTPLLVARFEMIHEQQTEVRTDEGAAAKSHDGHAGRHARAIGKPFHQSRNRRNVTQTEPATANHPVTKIDDPKLVPPDAKAEMIKPPLKQRAAVNIVLRGPTRSTQRPKHRRRKSEKKMARLKIHASDGCDQSSGADLVTPMILVSGNLKTLNA